VTSSASNAASRANTANLSGAFVASAFALAARASANAVWTFALALADAFAASASRHVEHRLASGDLLFNCARENPELGFSTLHTEHKYVVPSSSAMRIAAAARESARSASSALATQRLHFTFAFASALRFCCILALNSMAGSDVR
jgi:hypothetical protein